LITALALEESQRVRTVAHQEVLGLLVVTEHHLVVLPSDPRLLVSAERRARRAGFQLRRVTFGGEGVAPEFAGESWPAVRDTIYRERGA